MSSEKDSRLNEYHEYKSRFQSEEFGSYAKPFKVHKQYAGNFVSRGRGDQLTNKVGEMFTL